MLLGQQPDYTKYLCFLCEWDSVEYDKNTTYKNNGIFKKILNLRSKMLHKKFPRC